MKRKAAIVSLLVLILFFPLFAGLAHTQEKRDAKCLIFMVDVSKSMLQPKGLFDRIKQEIVKYLRGEVNPPDLVTIFTFGDNVIIASDVPNLEVRGNQDIERLTATINKLKADNNKTWLSKAIDNMAKLMKDTREKYPNMQIISYLFTDGKNDPPIGVPQDSLSLEETIKKHYAVFNNPKNYVYIITLGVKPEKPFEKLAQDNPETVRIIEEKKEDIIKKPQKPIIPPPPVIKDEFIDISSKEIKISTSTSGGKEAFFIEGKNGTSKEQEKIIIELEPSEKYLQIIPSEVSLPKGDFKVSLQLSIPQKEKGQSDYKLKLLSPRPEMKIRGDVAVKLAITEPIDWTGIIKKLIPIVIILTIIIILFILLQLVNREFAKWNISGYGLDGPLSDFKQFFSHKLTLGKNIYGELSDKKQFLEIGADFQTFTGNGLYLLGLDEAVRNPKKDEKKRIETQDIFFKQYIIKIKSL